MTKKEAIAEFRELILPEIRKIEKELGFIDETMRREEWNNFVDYLRTDRRITHNQYNTWNNPY